MAEKPSEAITPYIAKCLARVKELADARHEQVYDRHEPFRVPTRDGYCYAPRFSNLIGINAFTRSLHLELAENDISVVLHDYTGKLTLHDLLTGRDYPVGYDPHQDQRYTMFTEDPGSAERVPFPWDLWCSRTGRLTEPQIELPVAPLVPEFFNRVTAHNTKE